MPGEAWTHSGEAVRTEIPPEGEWPEAWPEVVDAMGAMLVHLVATADDPSLGLRRADPFAVGIYSVGDFDCFWRVSLSGGEASVGVEHE